VVGGTAAGAGNTIAHNGVDGVVVRGNATGNRLLGNAIHDNGGLGIDLADDGLTPNDPGDADTGSNHRQNFPVLTAAVTGGSTQVQGNLNSLPGITFRLEFFSDTTCTAGAEGRTFLVAQDVTTDSGGNAAFSVTPPSPVPAGRAVTATATDPAGNTSEFAACVAVQATNQPPVNTVPGPQTTAEDTALVFSAAAGNAIAVADPDAGANPVQVTLTATNGTLTLRQTTGLAFTAGDGTADPTMTFTGTVADINAALDGLSFAPMPGFSGSAGLTIVTNDQGATGAGGALSDTDSARSPSPPPTTRRSTPSPAHR
jgi:hypothetical protein